MPPTGRAQWADVDVSSEKAHSTMWCRCDAAVKYGGVPCELLRSSALARHPVPAYAGLSTRSGTAADAERY